MVVVAGSRRSSRAVVLVVVGYSAGEGLRVEAEAGSSSGKLEKDRTKGPSIALNVCRLKNQGLELKLNFPAMPDMPTC